MASYGRPEPQCSNEVSRMQVVLFKRKVVLLVALAAVLVGTVAQAAELRAGRAAVDITPSKGMPMAGYYHVRLNEGTHDELQSKAIVFEYGSERAALVALDLVSIPKRFVVEARRLIEARNGIPASHVMISATHSHTGPSMGSRLQRADNKAAKIAADYHKALPGLIAESVEQAVADLQPATVSAAVGHEDSISFIRRFRMEDGSTGWNPGKLNPNIIEPLGEIDPAVPVVYFETPDQKPLATYVNFANHLDTVGGMEFSADYPYTVAKMLAEVRGPEMVTAFTIGTAGNINHLDVKSGTPQKGHGEAARIGTILAGEVLRTFRKLEMAEPGAVQGSRRIVPLKTPTVTSEDVTWAQGVVDRYGKPGASPFYDQVKAFKFLELKEHNGKPIDAEVQVITIGDEIAWVALPGEIFVELGQAIKLASPYPITIIAELANGSIGYVPDRRAYPQGAYEVISARVPEGSGEKMAEAAIDMLIEHHKTVTGDHPGSWKR